MVDKQHEPLFSNDSPTRVPLMVLRRGQQLGRPRTPARRTLVATNDCMCFHESAPTNHSRHTLFRADRLFTVWTGTFVTPQIRRTRTISHRPFCIEFGELVAVARMLMKLAKY